MSGVDLGVDDCLLGVVYEVTVILEDRKLVIQGGTMTRHKHWRTPQLTSVAVAKEVCGLRRKQYSVHRDADSRLYVELEFEVGGQKWLPLRIIIHALSVHDFSEALAALCVLA